MKNTTNKFLDFQLYTILLQVQNCLIRNKIISATILFSDHFIFNDLSIMERNIRTTLTEEWE